MDQEVARLLMVAMVNCRALGVVMWERGGGEKEMYAHCNPQLQNRLVLA